jgi:hypothetical protein
MALFICFLDLVKSLNSGLIRIPVKLLVYCPYVFLTFLSQQVIYMEHLKLHMHIIYIYIYICMYVYIFTRMCVFVGRERQRETERENILLPCGHSSQTSNKQGRSFRLILWAGTGIMTKASYRLLYKTH